MLKEARHVSEILGWTQRASNPSMRGSLGYISEQGYLSIPVYLQSLGKIRGCPRKSPLNLFLLLITRGISDMLAKLKAIFLFLFIPVVFNGISQGLVAVQVYIKFIQIWHCNLLVHCHFPFIDPQCPDKAEEFLLFLLSHNFHFST